MITDQGIRRARSYREVASAPPLRILLVEDSALLALRIEEFIQRVVGAPVIATVDTEAAAVMHLRMSSPDVVILDIHLRQGTGIGVLRALGGATHPRVIVLTNFPRAEYRRAAESLGAYAFLDKSCDVGQLGPLLLGLIDRARATDLR